MYSTGKGGVGVMVHWSGTSWPLLKRPFSG